MNQPQPRHRVSFRCDPDLYRALGRLAVRSHRSANAQAEAILTDALTKELAEVRAEKGAGS
jgi:hypothetical protein